MESTPISESFNVMLRGGGYDSINVIKELQHSED